MQRIGRFGGSWSLIVASGVLLLATAYLYVAYGPTAYFVAFHRPFHLTLPNSTPTYTPPVLPHFKVTASIASRSLSPGDTQVITVTETPDRSAKGYIQVWVQGAGMVNSDTECALSCFNKEVYENDTSGPPIQFIAGKTNTFTYDFMLPDNLRAGTYKVSDIITSSDTFTDYSVNNNFAEFTVQ